jgi:hypothetical protein
VELEIRSSSFPSLFLLPLIILFYRPLPILLPFDVLTTILRVCLFAHDLGKLSLTVQPCRISYRYLSFRTFFYQRCSVRLGRRTLEFVCKLDRTSQNNTRAHHP